MISANASDAWLDETIADLPESKTAD